MVDMTVANEILRQLGGNKFLIMTGANHLIRDTYSLSMKLPRNMSKANRLTIELQADDTYKMRFRKHTPDRLNKKTFEFKPGKIEDIKVFDSVYYDQLQELFTSVTGMYTHL